jgi:hypothetical protein
VANVTQRHALSRLPEGSMVHPTTRAAGSGERHQAADGINPINAARTASSRSASVKATLVARSDNANYSFSFNLAK